MNKIAQINQGDQFAKFIDFSKSQQIIIRDVLRFLVSQFSVANLYYGHGTRSSHQDAEYLLAGLLNLEYENLNIYLDAKLMPDELNIILDQARKRVFDKIPVAYLTKQASLAGFKFYVDDRVIIPRSFLANIILNGVLLDCMEKDKANKFNNNTTNTNINILDLCTGNGSLAIILANYFPSANVFGVDISHDAIKVAEINNNYYKKQYNINGVTFVQGDLFENIIIKNLKFDLIVTNPPYVDSKKMALLPDEYLHEPRIALDGGHDGLDIISRIIHQASDFLTEDGLLLVEMGDNIKELQWVFPNFKPRWLCLDDNEYGVIESNNDCVGFSDYSGGKNGEFIFSASKENLIYKN